jgi:DNA polymerase elongation subunit (family B)
MDLNVPVAMFPTTSGNMLVVGNGEFFTIDFPVRPYKTSVSDVPGRDQEEHVSLIGGGEGYVTKQEYDVVPMSRTLENKMVPEVDYMLELVKDHPEVIESVFEQPYVPYPLFLDIETDSREGHFSKASRGDEILSIQVKYPDMPRTEILYQTSQYGEKDMIHDFIEFCRKSPSGKSPDIVVGYALNRFDVPYIKERARACGLRDELLTLDRPVFEKEHGRPSLIYPSWIRSRRKGGRYSKKKAEDVDLAQGLLNMDLYLHAKIDLVLKELPSRSLKLVAAAYGSQDVVDLEQEDKSRMRWLLLNEKDKFMKYSESDIIQTEYLYNIYSNRLIASSNLISSPMMLTHHATSGQKSYIVLYRECRKHGYYAKESNLKRYDHLYMRAPKYQGALVGCFKTGYFPKSIYVDCKSMYPNIMHDYNISFDRYEVLDTIDYSDWEDELQNITQELDSIGLTPDDIHGPQIVAYGPPEAKIIYIPDDNYRLVFKFKFNLVEDGFVRRMVAHYNLERFKFKQKSKEHLKLYQENQVDRERVLAMMYDSMQAESKVLNNTFYGVMAQKFYEIADLPAAIFVTAIGRWIMQEMISILRDASIEVDTDGLLLDRTKFDLSLEEINNHIRKRQHDTFGVPYDKMMFDLEFEGKGSVYVYKKKNYILRLDGSEKLTTKGSAFTGYDRAPVALRAVKIMSQCVMNTGEYASLSYKDAVKMAMDIRRLPLEDFKFTKVLKKNVDEYKGFEGLTVFAKQTIDMSIMNTKQALREAKIRAISFIEKRFKTDDRLMRYKSLVRDCKTMSQLDMVLGVIDDVIAGEKKGRKNKVVRYFILDLILLLKMRGQELEEDDVVEYYYTRSSTGYSVADDVKGIDDLNFERYEKELKTIIERFSMADPSVESLSLDIM